MTMSVSGPRMWEALLSVLPPLFLLCYCRHWGIFLLFTAHLWDKNQTQYHSSAEDNKESCNSKRGILCLLYHQCRRNTNHAQDDNIVHRHPNIARVVKCGNVNVSCFPREEDAKQQQEAFGGKKNAKPDGLMLAVAVFPLRQRVKLDPMLKKMRIKRS